jgi:hypothetical protein
MKSRDDSGGEESGEEHRKDACARDAAAGSGFSLNFWLLVPRSKTFKLTHYPAAHELDGAARFR